ncbi:MAG: hypothetical protein M3336_01010 [Chloroflexota bacterium]|nr:hypothetical protein [Chloroflexota bacterium]
MIDTRVLLDPTGERQVATRERAPRLGSLKQASVALLDISKPRGDVFLDCLEALLRARGVGVTRFRKPTYARPAPLELRREIAARCQALIEALAD